MLPDRIAYRVWDWCGYWLVEIGLRCGFGRYWWGDGIYRLGERCYERGFDAAERCGALIPNPNAEEAGEPRFIWAPWTGLGPRGEKL